MRLTGGADDGVSGRIVMPLVNRTLCALALGLASLVTLILFGGLGVPHAHAQLLPCAAPDRLKDAKLFDQALALYADLIENDNLPCARRAVSDIAEARGQAAGLLAEGLARQMGGAAGDVERFFVEALALDPELEAAQQALADVLEPEKEKSKLAPVGALSDAGFHDEAAEKLREILVAEPGTTIPSELEYLEGGHRSLVQTWKQNVPDLLYWPSFVVEGVIAVLLGGAVLAILGYKLRSDRRLPKLEVKDFKKGPISADIGQNVSARLEECLLAFDVDRVRPSMNLLSGPVEGIKIPAELGVPAQAKWLALLVEWAFPRQDLALEGYLQKLPDRGLGLMLQLTKRSEQIASVTLWQRDFAVASKLADADEQEAFDKLAEIGAVWVLFKLAEEVQQGIAPLGVGDWRSYALYRMGVRNSRVAALADALAGEPIAEHRDNAIALYKKALAIEPENQGALTNLGKELTRKREFEAAVSALKNAKAAIERIAKREKLEYRYDGAWYYATYHLAVSLEYRGRAFWEGGREAAAELVDNLNRTIIEVVERPDRRSPRKQPISQEPRVVAETVKSGAAILKLEEELVSRPVIRAKSRKHRQEQRLLNFLRDVRRPSIFVYATLLQKTGDREHAKQLVDQVSPTDRQLTVVRYEFACYYAACAETSAGDDERKTYWNSALEQLKLALLADPDLLATAERDPSLAGLRGGDSYRALIRELFPEPSAANLPVKSQGKAAAFTTTGPRATDPMW